MADQKKLPHPENNPQYSKVDYIRNAVYALVRMELALYIGEGASLPKAAALAQQLQECIQRAYHAAIQEAGIDITGPMPDPPPFGEGLDPNNPFGSDEAP